MAWTTPRTWASGEIVTETIMNEHIRDNLNHLHDRQDTYDEYTVNEGADYTTTSTTFVDIDATDLALTITTHGGPVLIGFAGAIASGIANNSAVYLDITVDGVREGGDDGIVMHQVGTDDDQHPQMVSFVVLIPPLTAGSHTFKLQWKINTGGGTYTMHAGAGTATYDVHPQFWVQEV